MQSEGLKVEAKNLNQAVLPDGAVVAKPLFRAAAFKADGMLPGQVGGIALEGLLFFYFQSCNKSRRGDRKQETYSETEQSWDAQRGGYSVSRGHRRWFTAPGIAFLN